VHIRVTIIKSEITLVFERGGGVGSPMKKGDVGEVVGCNALERRGSQHQRVVG
jgi:hypothetical protein